MNNAARTVADLTEKFYQTALDLGVVRISDLRSLGADDEVAVSTIMGWAFVARMDGPAGQAAHAALCEVNDALGAARRAAGQAPRADLAAEHAALAAEFLRLHD
jgi:hypothetical protein